MFRLRRPQILSQDDIHECGEFVEEEVEQTAIVGSSSIGEIEIEGEGRIEGTPCPVGAHHFQETTPAAAREL